MPTLWRTFWISIFAAATISLAIVLLGPRLSEIELLPDQGFAWYYWKLPVQTLAGQLSAWGFYILHQCFFWGLIWWAQKNRDKLRDRRRLHPINIIGLLGTAVFALLHYAQTAIWYDGLAQDTSVFSSQASVILLLVLVLMIEAPRRGLVFGGGGRWLSGIRPILIQYHGYYFAWAITYTFWFHPMEATAGHIAGFFYTLLLMIQGAMAFTRVHTNKWWTFVLEASVLIHGVIVALTAGQDFWTMFFFGFLTIFVVTQMHGLGLSRLIRAALAAFWLVAIVFVYQAKGWEHANEVLRIPAIDYLLVAALGGVMLLVQRLIAARRAA